MVVSIIIAAVLAVIFMGYRVAYADKSNVNGVIGTLIKAVASLGFIAIGFTAILTMQAFNNGALFIIAGQIFGMIGDIVLDLKVVYQGKKEEGVYLTGGMVTFGLGHIMYFIAILLYLTSNVLSLATIGICIAVAAVAAFAIVFGGEKLMGFKFGKFTIHSVCYGFLLIFMSAISIAGWVLYGNQNPHMPVFAVGMILFLLSDIFLTQMYFGGKPNDKLLCIINHSLYYAAQICVASFIFYM